MTLSEAGCLPGDASGAAGCKCNDLSDGGQSKPLQSHAVPWCTGAPFVEGRREAWLRPSAGRWSRPLPARPAWARVRHRVPSPVASFQGRSQSWWISSRLQPCVCFRAHDEMPAGVSAAGEAAEAGARWGSPAGGPHGTRRRAPLSRRGLCGPMAFPAGVRC